jgi:carboxymethylenebutenolidase
MPANFIDYGRACVRAVLAVLLGSLLCASSFAQAPSFREQDVPFVVDKAAVIVKAYLPDQPREQRAVILLHGRGGFDGFRSGFTRHAMSLAGAGFQVYLFPYYNASDSTIMETADREARQKHFRSQIDKWAARVVLFASSLRSREQPVSSVALVGFSNGGFVAVAAAARGQLFSHLVVLYGGLPDWLPGSITSLPQTLIIHGEADRVVPIAEGEKLLAAALRVAPSAELVRVPGADHGFDLAKDDSRSLDARNAVIKFLVSTSPKR